MGPVPIIGAVLRRFAHFFKNRVESAEPHAASLDLGREGERRAAIFLRKSGYKVLLRNVRLGREELDLVCRDRDELVFIEVKTRSDDSWSRPALAVNARKRRRMIHAAMLYLRELDNPQIIYRFDVVEVIARDSCPWEINVIRNAFGR